MTACSSKADTCPGHNCPINITFNVDGQRADRGQLKNSQMTAKVQIGGQLGDSQGTVTKYIN